MTSRRVTLFAVLAIATLSAGCSKQDERVEYTTPDGKKTSNIKDLKEGDVGYRVSGGGKAIPARAQQLHQEARAQGEAGDYASALSLLKQASEVAPNWPYPPYDMAFTYLLQGDRTNALLKYREVDRMEPRGFFTTKTALWTLEREEKGLFPKGTYLAFVSLEWAEPQKKREMIEQMTTNLPTFAPGLKEKALLVEGTDQQLGYLEKALALEPDPETYGTCMLNKASLLSSAGRTAEAKRMVEELIRNDSSTLGTKALAKELLKTFKQ